MTGDWHRRGGQQGGDVLGRQVQGVKHSLADKLCKDGVADSGAELVRGKPRSIKQGPLLI